MCGGCNSNLAWIYNCCRFPIWSILVIIILDSRYFWIGNRISRTVDRTSFVIYSNNYVLTSNAAQIDFDYQPWWVSWNNSQLSIWFCLTTLCKEFLWVWRLYRKWVILWFEDTALCEMWLKLYHQLNYTKLETLIISFRVIWCYTYIPTKTDKKYIFLDLELMTLFARALAHVLK